jgi:small GTP-binding protein
MAAQPAYAFKFIVIGSSGVGKTCILRRLVEDSFKPDSPSTIGVEFDSTIVDVDGNDVKLQIWDTAGQERFRSISKAYFRNAVGVILVFDIAERKSFDEVNMWLTEVHSLCDPQASILLVGNKADKDESRVVSVSEAEQNARHHQLKYLETSALSGANIREAFLQVATDLYRKQLKEQPAPKPVPKNIEPTNTGCGC